MKVAPLPSPPQSKVAAALCTFAVRQRPLRRSSPNPPSVFSRADRQPRFQAYIWGTNFSLRHPTIFLSMIHNLPSIIQGMQHEGNGERLKSAKRNDEKEAATGFAEAPQPVTQHNVPVACSTLAEAAKRGGSALGIALAARRRKRTPKVVRCISAGRPSSQRVKHLQCPSWQHRGRNVVAISRPQCAVRACGS